VETSTNTLDKKRQERSSEADLEHVGEREQLIELGKKAIPSKFILKIDESKVPKKILEILHKRLDMRKHPYCVAFSMMQLGCYQGTWGNGSFRFLHCVCKMIDDGTPKLGTTMLTSIRAMKGWDTCDEDLWPSNLDLSVSEFEDWKSIPKEAWDDARQKRIEANRAILASWPSEILNLNGRVFRLITDYSDHLIGGEDAQYDITLINDDFDTAAWVQLRAYIQSKQIVLEELFVKPEFRRLHLGTRLLYRIEQICCLEPVFSELSNEVLVPIPVPDAGPNRYNVVKEFFQKNGYIWKTSDPIRRTWSYSIFTAVKKLNCAEIHRNYAAQLTRSEKYTQAEKHYQEALELKEDSPEAHNNYAHLLRILKRDGEAEMHARRALELKGDLEVTHYNYALLLRNMRRYYESDKHFKMSLEIKELPETHNGYALLLADVNRFEEANQHYRRAIELKRDFPEAHWNLAGLLFKMGNYPEAEEHYQQAIEIRDDYAVAHADYAFLLGNLKRYDEAEKHYRRAIEIKEKHGDNVGLTPLYGELGAFYEERGKLDAAEACYAKVLEESTLAGDKRLQEQASRDLNRVREKLKEKT
jgi:tetratricopeptide (TPR) repeat protein